MTSPRQRKKKLAILKLRKKQKDEADKLLKAESKPVESAPVPVVESQSAAKSKKPKTALVEMNPQDQVLEHSKEQVKTVTKE